VPDGVVDEVRRQALGERDVAEGNGETPRSPAAPQRVGVMSKGLLTIQAGTQPAAADPVSS
jgi:hypothetical protein